MEWSVLKLRRILYTGLESVTQGLARATSHRVLAPAAGTSPRYSIPFFQNIRQELRLSEHVLQRTSLSLSDSDSRDFISYPPCMWAVPTEVLKLKGRRGELGQTDCESDI
jgi:isopenicillin N synthase-like dioxygenase